MTIGEPNRIDIVGEHPDGTRVLLVIVDELDWSDVDAHERALQAKVNAYLEFIESGQLVETAPSAGHGAKIEIRLVLRHQPNARGQDFLERVGKFLEQEGYGFSSELKDYSA